MKTIDELDREVQQLRQSVGALVQLNAQLFRTIVNNGGMTIQEVTLPASTTAVLVLDPDVLKTWRSAFLQKE